MANGTTANTFLKFSESWNELKKVTKNDYRK